MDNQPVRSARRRSRRHFLKQAGVAGILSFVPDALRTSAWAAGSDAPEKKEVKIGFIPLTDCSSVVMAAVMEFDKKYGVKIIPSKEASWAAVRDKLVNGENDASHLLYGLAYGAAPGRGGAEKGNGRLDEPEPQRPGNHALEQACGQRRERWYRP